MRYSVITFLAGLALLIGNLVKPEEVKKGVPKKKEFLATKLFSKPEVPILCYHRIRNSLVSHWTAESNSNHF